MHWKQHPAITWCGGFCVSWLRLYYARPLCFHFEVGHSRGSSHSQMRFSKWYASYVWPQASQAHVMSMECKLTLLYFLARGDRWDVVWEIRYWGLRTLNIIIFYLFFYKIYKGDFPLIYSCIFLCEFIDLVGFFFCCYFVTLVTPFIIRSKGRTGKQPTVRTLSSRRRFAGPKTHQIAKFFWPEAKL